MIRIDYTVAIAFFSHAFIIPNFIAWLFFSPNTLSHFKGNTMNPLSSIHGTIVAGFVLAIVLGFVVKAIAGG